ncbi:MAG: ATP-binding cassette domain-containing protein [Oscillospiraceae bacterium]
MLEIKNIVKDYQTGDEVVHALRDVSISFRESELVSVLGQSGCGKTTLLNIIGGLDQYTSGDLIINGKSTKQFKSRDWDTYRNHSVGFIFQSYNLIPHQSVLSNVELALTLSGVSKTERRQRAKEALEKVGLGNQLNKRPNQMSGGQMQRVAIARALVNDPDILLADEPTGALDSETSVQIMELIKEIAKDRLVIMVTHNPELAEKYSTRIIRLLDGQLISDSDPYSGEGAAEKKSAVNKGKKTSMSFATALSLSKNNLMTKKGRTFLTSFAGSIGIIGIALILSLSNGVQEYINSVETSTLASYPVQIQSETIDYGGMMQSMMGVRENMNADREPDRIYTNNISTEMTKTMLSEVQTNNLAAFKAHLESDPDGISQYISEVKYSYSPNLYIYSHDINDNIVQVNPSTVMEAMMGKAMAESVSQMSSTYSGLMGATGNQYDCWDELLGNETLESQYKLLAGRLPDSWDEVVVIVTEHNELSDVTLYSLGLRDQSELKGMMSAVMAGDTFDVETGDLSFTYDELLGLDFRFLTAPDFYKKNADGVWEDMRGDEEYMNSAIENAPQIKVVGIIKPDGDSLINSARSGGIGYTHALTEHMIETVNNSEIVKEQQANPAVDIFTGIEFPTEGKEEEKAMSEEEAMGMIMQMMSTEQIAKISQDILSTLTPEQQQEIMTAGSEEMQNMLFDFAGPEAVQAAMLGSLTQEQQSLLSQDIMAALTPEQQAELMNYAADPAAMQQAMLAMADPEQVGAMVAGMLTPEQQAAASQSILMSLTPEQQEELTTAASAKVQQKLFETADRQAIQNAFLNNLTSEQVTELMNLTKAPEKTEATFDGNLELLGVADLAKPSSISIYAKDFEGKEKLTQFITDYNSAKREAGKEADVINYTDYVGLMISSVSAIIDSISYILIAFVAISLVVSSIMIGIITYISVLERTKEIGILRAIGASKRDISRVFNAETLIVGFTAGVIGIGVTLLLNIPINLIIYALTDIENMAQLPWVGGIVLVLISMALTLIAGLFPAGVASRKDPVVALRTE